MRQNASAAKIADVLRDQLGCGEVSHEAHVGGGCICEAARFKTDKGLFFAKWHHRMSLEPERRSLEALYEADVIRVPETYVAGELDNGASYLIMEYIELRGAGGCQAELGRQLAELHLKSGSQSFGFDIDNSIGSTPQQNPWTDDWVDFFTEQRLRYQLDLSDDPPLLTLGERLIERIPELFEGLEIQPSLIHGDLWCGNIASDTAGRPVIFDPATYYAHHEAELGICTMFGGFSQNFWGAYHDVIPRSPGFERRHMLYKLYHTLNHYNLFGSSYHGACVDLMQRLLA